MARSDGRVPGPGAAISECVAPLHAAWSDLETGLASDLLDVVRRAAEEHGDSVRSLGLNEDPPGDPEAIAEQLLAYRRAVGSKLLEPLGTALANRGPTSTIERAAREALESCASRCRALPLEAAVAWPEGALAPNPHDGSVRRVGKVLARAFSAARKAGEERTVSPRGIALRHLERRIAPALDGACLEAALAWAGWARRLELAWVEWGDAALPSLVRAELPDRAEAERAWEIVRASAADLQARLEASASENPMGRALEAFGGGLAAARGALEADLAVAGSFLLRNGEPGGTPTLTRLSKGVDAFAEWEEGVAARMQLFQALIAILAGGTAVQKRLIYRVRERCLANTGDFASVAARLDQVRASGLDRGAAADVEGRLREVQSSVDAALQPALRAIPDADFVDAAVREVSDATVEALLAVVRQAPPRLVVHGADAMPPARGKRPETRAVPLQQLARQSFDALRIERIRSSTAGLVKEIDEARAIVTGLPEVYGFAHGEALRELEGAGDGAERRAVDLASGALQSMAESLRAQVEEIRVAVADAQAVLAGEIGDGSTALLDRVEAGRVEAQFLAARSRFADLIGWVREQVGPRLAAAATRARAAWARTREVVQGLLRKGSAAVGGTPAEEAASTQAVRTLAHAGEVVARLPLVYQRLFTMQPLVEPTLLVARSAELEAGMEGWTRWKSGEGVPLVVRARQGSGVTSLLNVLGGRIEADGGRLARVTLESRIPDESELARLLATELGLAACDNLDDLAASVFDAPASSLPSAVSVDNLEHVYLRVAGGTDLPERFLTLMAETAPRIFWFAGVTASAWQLVAAAEPSAVGQVEVRDLGPLGADALREAILVRHRRSGLEVRYEEGATGRQLLRRRLRRGRDARRHQDLVEQDFFDRLQRVSDGFLTLALFQWLLSADFDAGDGVLMRYPERPDFSVLGSLDLTQNFSLKAFLEHRTLTLDEHDRIFRLPRHETYQLFESLRNRHLIEAVRTGHADEAVRSEIEDDLRYRLRPLLTGPIITHLRGRNIVH